MIFSEQSIRNILANKKCQTRRLSKDAEDLLQDENGVNSISVWSNVTYWTDGRIKRFSGKRRVKWVVGKNYAVQAGRGKKGRKELRIKVLSLKQEKLLDISKEDAIKEGYNSIVEYLDNFLKINHKDSSVLTFWNPSVWVISFEVLK